MSIQCLQLIACFGRPYLTSLVTRGGNNLVTLRIELNLTDLILVTLK